MSIKQTFRAFTVASLLLEQMSAIATNARLEDYQSKTIKPELNIDWVLGAIPAQTAFLAFSVELGIKTLLIKSNTILEPRGHNLKVLFDKLPQEIKTHIYNGLAEDIEDLDMKKFNTLLDKNAKSFESWRYFHETESLSCDKDFLGRLLISIHNFTVNNNH